MPPPATEQPDSTTSPGLSPDSNPRRWSFPGHFMLRRNKPKAPPSPAENKHGDATVSAAPADKAKKRPSAFSSSDRRAKQSALVVRSLIVGQDTDEGGLASPQVPVSNAQLKHVKAQLMKPKSAGKVIAHLRALPALSNSSASASEPIQAVCLPYTDEEADEKYLSRFRDLKPASQPQPPQPPTSTTKTDTPRPLAVASSTIESVAEAVRNLRVVNLFTAPDLGLGQPEDGPGLLAGALPTAEMVINGVTQITPQLMALSYATGHALIPDHKGVYPPTDRMSVLTCTPSLFDALSRRREMSDVFA